MVVNWPFVFTFRIAAGQATNLQLLSPVPLSISPPPSDGLRKQVGFCWRSRKPWLWVWLCAREKTAVRSSSQHVGIFLSRMLPPGLATGATTLPSNEAVPPGLCQNVACVRMWPFHTDCVSWPFGRKQWFIGKGYYVLYKYVCASCLQSMLQRPIQKTKCSSFLLCQGSLCT